MKNRTLERALYGPTIYEVTIGFLLSISLGAALAVLFLIFKPAEVVAELPKEDERQIDRVYYVAGTADQSKGKQWMRKRQLLIDSMPGEISFSEDDLNVCLMSSTDAGKQATEKQAKALLEAAAKTAAAKPVGKPTSKSGNKSAAAAVAAPAIAPTPEELPPEELITPSVPNFRIRDGVVQIGLESTINPLGYVFPVVVQARGGFVKQDDMFVYVPETLMIGSFPLHRFPHAIEYLMKYLTEKATTSEAMPTELLAAWKKVRNIAVEGKVIKVTI